MSYILKQVEELNYDEIIIINGIIRSGFIEAICPTRIIDVFIEKLISLMNDENLYEEYQIQLILITIDNIIINCSPIIYLEKFNEVEIIVNLFVFTCDVLPDSIKGYSYKLLISFIKFTQMSEKLLEIDGFIPLLMHEYQNNIYALALLEEVLDCNIRNEIPLPELSEEDICTIEELIQSNDESFAKIAQNIKNMVISSE